MKIISSILLILGMALILNYKVISLNNTYIKNNNYNYKGDNIWVINIPKINMNYVVTLANINSTSIKGVVLFKEYGRPDIDRSNTVIGAHSGTGPDALFNDIDKLDVKDIVNLYYNFKEYKYKIVSRYKVKETNLSPLNNNENRSILTLITCNKNNFKERLIVVADRV